MKLEGSISRKEHRISGNLPGNLSFGVNGATFYPHVSEDGWLSWTNDRNLPNPEPVQIGGAVDEETLRRMVEEYLKEYAPEDGEDGITPHIGANGNWYIADTDTGSITVPHTTSGGKCEIYTDTGNIFIKIEDNHSK